MRHIEFLDTDHFEDNYYRTPPPAALAHFIDFFWETNFEHLWETYPGGFSDAQFANIGYTYIISLGTPFIMQVGDEQFERRTDLFLPRHKAIECFHQPGNKLFGIKFRISPVLFEKKINFSEYSQYLFPLSYLLDLSVITRIKSAPSFEDRTNIVSNYFLSLLSKHDGTTLNNGKPAIDVRTNNTFTLSNGWSTELNANFNSGGQYGFMVQKPQWGIAAGVQKTMLKNRATVRFNISDIFWTNLPRAVITYNNYIEKWHAYRETRVANLSFTYRFGRNTIQASRRRTSGSEEERQRAGN